MGDGSLTIYKKAHDYYIEVYDADRDFLMDVAREIRTALKVNVKIKSPQRHNYHKLRISNKELFLVLKDLIKERLERPTKAFVRGIVDAEGTLYVDKKGRIALEISNTNELVIKAIHKYLKRRKIHHTITRHKERGRRILFKVRVRGWNNVEYFISHIKPRHPKIILKFLELKPLKN